MAARMERSYAWLVAEDGGKVVGYAYSGRFHERAAYRWSVEVSVYIGEGHRGTGIGRSLLTRLLEELRERGFVNVFAGVTLPNDASVGLFESIGFERIALQKKVGFKLGEWHDVGWWELHIAEHASPPPEPDRTQR